MISIVYDVNKYRELLAETVQKGDVVVEIGPHVGLSTKSYIEKADKTIIVDKGLDCLDDLKNLAESNDKIEFICGDVRGFDSVNLVLHHIQTCDVLAVDMGGGRFPDTVFKVWGTWSGVLKPRDSLIRSRGLIEFVRRARAHDDSIPEDFADNGWLAFYGRGKPYALKKQLDEFKHWVDIEKRISDDKQV